MSNTNRKKGAVDKPTSMPSNEAFKTGWDKIWGSKKNESPNSSEGRPSKGDMAGR